MKPPKQVNILDDVSAIFDRYLVLPSPEARDAITLWTAHTHAFTHGAVRTTPRLALLSPEGGSGKSTVLDVLASLVADPILAQDITGPAMFRLISQGNHTFLLDEIDCVFGVNGSSTRNTEKRSIANSGYRPGRPHYRATGKEDVIQEPTFAPMAFAGIGNLPDTLMSRSIVIRMVKKLANQYVDDFEETAETIVHLTQDQLAAWAKKDHKALATMMSTADVPSGVNNRDRQLWRTLIGIADHVGGTWPARARTACVELTRETTPRATDAERLLQDLQAVWVGPAMWTQDIIPALVNHEPDWADYDSRALGAILRPYGIKPTRIALGDKQAQGYRRAHLTPIWEKYVPALAV